MFQTQDQGVFLELAQASTGLGWWIADSRPGGRLTASPEARRIFGLPAEGCDGTAEAFWSLIHPEDSARILGAVAATLRDHAPFQAEHRIVTAGGSVRHVLMSAVADPHDPGGPPGCWGSAMTSPVGRGRTASSARRRPAARSRPASIRRAS